MENNEKLPKNFEPIIVYETKKWRVIIEDLYDAITMYFQTNPSRFTIQGEVDEALEKKYGWETKIGIGDLEMTMDDGLYGVYYGDYPTNEIEQVKPKIVEYLTNIFYDNKKEFTKRIKKDLKYYDKL